MLKKILGTIGTRYFIALLNLALIFINAKTLGVEGLGMIGLIVASINIAVIFNSIFCGNTIVYFMNRYALRMIFTTAYVWAFIGSALACGCMSLTGLLPVGYGTDIYLLAVLNSVVTVNARFLLGKDHIKGFNLTFVLQGGLLFFVLIYLYYGADVKEVRSYIWGLYITNGVAFLGSILLLLPYLHPISQTVSPSPISHAPSSVSSSVPSTLPSPSSVPPTLPSSVSSSVPSSSMSPFSRPPKDTDSRPPLYLILKEMFIYGLWSGADNLAEVCTTRLNYFLIQRFLGLGGVGLLDAGTKISESVWHISRSVSFIEYSSVARTREEREQKKITLQLFKLTACAMILVMGCILVIPEWVYTRYLFTSQFQGMRSVIFGLSPGIIALGCNSILGHYFIGSGKIRYSTASSCIGLLTLLPAGYLLIPAYGVVGSALSTSIAFLSMLLFSVRVFTLQTHTAWYELLPSAEDWNSLKKLIQLKWNKC